MIQVPLDGEGPHRCWAGNNSTFSLLIIGIGSSIESKIRPSILQTCNYSLNLNLFVLSLITAAPNNARSLKSKANLRPSKWLITRVVYTHLIQHTRSKFLTLFSILFAYKYKSIPQDGTFLLATHTIINTYPLQMFPDFYDM